MQVSPAHPPPPGSTMMSLWAEADNCPADTTHAATNNTTAKASFILAAKVFMDSPPSLSAGVQGVSGVGDGCPATLLRRGPKGSRPLSPPSEFSAGRGAVTGLIKANRTRPAARTRGVHLAPHLPGFDPDASSQWHALPQSESS